MELSSENDLSLHVINENGDPVGDVTVVFEPESAMGDPFEVSTDSKGKVTVESFIERANASLREDQNRGTYAVELIPPAGSKYVDERMNQEIVILNS